MIDSTWIHFLLASPGIIKFWYISDAFDLKNLNKEK